MMGKFLSQIYTKSSSFFFQCHSMGVHTFQNFINFKFVNVCNKKKIKQKLKSHHSILLEAGSGWKSMEFIDFVYIVVVICMLISHKIFHFLFFLPCGLKRKIQGISCISVIYRHSPGEREKESEWEKKSNSITSWSSVQHKSLTMSWLYFSSLSRFCFFLFCSRGEQFIMKLEWKEEEKFN